MRYIAPQRVEGWKLIPLSNEVIMEEDIDVDVGVDVSVNETDTTGGEGDNGVDSWAVRGIIRAVVRGVYLSGKRSGDEFF